MTETLKEQLSCFLDGELPEAETTLLLKRLERDEELKGTLSRYSLIGAVLRAEGDVPAARNVAARVRAVVSLEPALRDAPLGPRGRWLRPVAGLALAAGVAAATVLVLPGVQRDSGAAPERVAVVAASPLVAEFVPVVVAADDVDEAPPSYTTPPAPAGSDNALSPAQLASYLLAHSEYTDPLGRRSVVTGAGEPAVEAGQAAGGGSEVP